MPVTSFVSPGRAEWVEASRNQAVEVSIIVPTLNEARVIESQAEALGGLPRAEVIFSDGGSTDGTQRLIESASNRSANLHLVHARRGRSCQMNTGAKRAQGEWLIFLHADTKLPAESYHAFLKIVHSNALLGAGAFTFRVDHPGWIYRYLEFYVRMRCRLLKLPYGDQAIFVRRNLFEASGGFREDSEGGAHIILTFPTSFSQAAKKHLTNL